MNTFNYHSKRFIATFVIFCFLLSITFQSAFAVNIGRSYEILLPSEALQNSSILLYLNENNKLSEFYEVQHIIRQNADQDAAAYSAKLLGDTCIDASEVQRLRQKYNLLVPSESNSGIINNGYMYVARDSRGTIYDVWYLYYLVSDTGFSINAALIDIDNPLDSITGTVTYYTLSGTSWVSKMQKSLDYKNVWNGNIFTWYVTKWGVKEKFEYDITVNDNGSTFKFSNTNKNDYVRYNFDAQPYNSFSANGGQRHHFVSKSALTSNGYNANNAYCIRMMTEDHMRTGSYGSPTYVSQESTLLKNRLYESLLQKEVNDLKSAQDSEGIAGSLHQKYYNEVVTCLYQYEGLFGIN